MELDGKYRHELKYKIHFSEYLAIRQRLRAVMRPDPHAGADGTYQIRSIYFDNVYDKAGDHRGRVPGASFRGYGLDAGAFGGAGTGALLQNEEPAAAAQGSGFL